jgi:cell division septation protein DedD
LKDQNEDLALTENGGDVMIEDKKNGEVTKAVDKGNGETSLEGVPNQVKSDTQDNVLVPKPEHHNPNNFMKPDSTSPDVKVSIEEAVEDPNKAGMDRSYSVVFSGFESQEAANEFYSELVEMEDDLNAAYSDLDEMEEGNITFSETELEGVAEQMNEMREFSERIMSSQEGIDLAMNVIEGAEQVKAYSVLAAQAGHDLSEVHEAACAYSEYADNCLTKIYSEMDINEYFSQLDEEETNAYFSGLGEVEARVLANALEAGEPMTFSELEEEINAVYSELELETPMLECFSDNEEMNMWFSQLSEVEANAVYSALEENENLTFSEVNEILAQVNQPLDEMFSEMDEEELASFSEHYGEELSNMAFSMAADEEEVYTFSDFIEAVDEVTTFSDADTEVIAHNATQLDKAAADMEATGDPELAKKVKLLAESTKECSDAAMEQGHDTSIVSEACAVYSEMADKVLVANNIVPNSVYSDDVELFEDSVEYSEDDELENAQYSELEENVNYSEEEPRVFSMSTAETKVYSNPCLTSKI